MPVWLLLLPLLVLGSNGSLSCWVCSKAVSALAEMAEFAIPEGAAAEVLIAICMRRYDSQKLCRKVGQQMATLFISNFISNHINMDKKCTSFCSFSHPRYSIPGEVQRILKSQINPHESVLNLSSKYVHTQRYSLGRVSEISVLQVSDIHLDSHYTENASIFCQQPICCHSENGFPDNSHAKAKPYGHKNCDTPPLLFQSFLDFIKRAASPIDVILLTGDLSAHNQWQKTRKSILITEQEIDRRLEESFPSSIIIKAEGNNDYVPDHQFDGSKSPKLLTLTHIEVGSTLLTFLSLNTIAYDELNLYVLGDQSFAIFQLILLEQALRSYDNVYLVGHIPPTFGGAIEEYSIVFRALISKYKAKIKAQFYGHTHTDQLTLHTNPLQKATPASYAFVSPSLSPLYIGTSRARVYTIRVGEKTGVMDYSQYIFDDLERIGTANWKLEYRFKEKYGLQGDLITTQDVERIKQRVFGDEREQRKYVRTTGLNSEVGSRAHCNMLDDYSLRKTCLNRSSLLGNDRMAQVLRVMIGEWTYNPMLAR